MIYHSHMRLLPIPIIQKIAPVAPEKSSKSKETPAYVAQRDDGDKAAPPIVRGPSKREIK